MAAAGSFLVRNSDLFLLIEKYEKAFVNTLRSFINFEGGTLNCADLTESLIIENHFLSEFHKIHTDISNSQQHFKATAKVILFLGECIDKMFVS